MTAAGLLIAFDIGGTLITEPSPTDSPSQRTISAIRAVAEQGAIITLATGREVQDAVAFAQRHLPDCCMYAIGGNGKYTSTRHNLIPVCLWQIVCDCIPLDILDSLTDSVC